MIRAYFGDHSTFTDELLLPEAYGGQVAIMEANGDLIPDLLGNRPNSAGQLEKTLWINDNKGMAWKLEAFPGSSTPLKDPHSVASVDFDGDCMPDLFLDHADGSSQVWILDPSSGKFHFRMNVAAAGEVQGRGQVTFGDFDADGAVDMLFPICYPASDCSITNEIRIFYNVQKPVCSGLFSKNCRKSTALCTADDSFSFSPFTTATPNDNVVIVQVGPQVAGRLFAPMGESSVPLTLRAGDYNIDRFLDLLVPVLPTATNISQVTLWKNVPCTDSLCGSQATKSKRRTFVPVLGDSVSALSGIIGGTGGSWLDLDEDGSLDIMVSSETTNSINQKVTSMTAVTNNFFNDGYFVKTLGLNGLCTVNCGIKEIQLGNKPYGVNQHGAAWKYTLADLSGTQLVNAVPQLPQSAYSALQTPYVLSGLGRPSNYIDYVYMGVSVYGTGKGHWQSWPGIIPNSQVVVTPYPLNNPTNWAIELYISPSGALLWIALAVAACLIISGAGIVFFQWREKKADEAEKKEREHLFSFNAM
jgi:integrin alpha FG-GAP repeat containing protein 1